MESSPLSCTSKSVQHIAKLSITCMCWSYTLPSCPSCGCAPPHTKDAQTLAEWPSWHVSATRSNCHQDWTILPRQPVSQCVVSAGIQPTTKSSLDLAHVVTHHSASSCRGDLVGSATTCAPCARGVGMRLLPIGAEAPSDPDDGKWVEKPGYPRVGASWIHPPPAGARLPEFVFEENHVKNKNEPGPTFYVGSGRDCHIRLPLPRRLPSGVDGMTLVPERICRLCMEGGSWYFESLLPQPAASARAGMKAVAVHFQSEPLDVARRVLVQNGDSFTLVRPPTVLGFRIELAEVAVSLQAAFLEPDPCGDALGRDFPNKFPHKFPMRNSLWQTAPVPDELRRLAWQTDQMRRRSEEDQAFRPSDWASFSQYVKQHYYAHGIECTVWAETGRGRPVDPVPPSRSARPLPAWIAELLASERPIRGVDSRRELPFASALVASGMQGAAQSSPVAERHAGDATELCLNGAGGAHLPTDCESVEPAEESARKSFVTVRNPHLQQSFKEWLNSLDDELFLMRYHNELVGSFDSLEQVHEIYFRDGALDKRFFEDMGIRKLGHRRIFEKWFRDACAYRVNGAS